MSLFQPSYIFTSIQNGDAFKRETHKCQQEGGVRGYEFETPVPNIYLDEKELFSQRTSEFFTNYTPITCPSSSPPSSLTPASPSSPPPGSTLHLSFFPSPLFPRRTFLGLKWRCHSVSHRSRQILTHFRPNTHLVMMIRMHNILLLSSTEKYLNFIKFSDIISEAEPFWQHTRSGEFLISSVVSSLCGQAPPRRLCSVLCT